MLPDELQYPAAFYGGHAHFYERDVRYSPSYFGGPTSIRFSGLRHGPKRLHHIVTLNWDAIPGVEDHGFSDISLFYGMCYSGCTMSYQMTESLRFRLLELQPRKSSADWPYSKYPDLLPYVPLRLARRVGCSPERFREFLIQRGEINSKEVVVVIPPMFDLGMSLWGPSGDAEGVQVVFHLDLETRTVRAYNECT